MSSAPLTSATPAAEDRLQSAGLAEREVRRALSVLSRLARSPYVPARPTLRQAAFVVAPEREVLFTGSGGCGKTVGLLTAALANVDRPGYRALLVQRTLAGPVTLAEVAREMAGADRRPVGQRRPSVALPVRRELGLRP